MKTDVSLFNSLGQMPTAQVATVMNEHEGLVEPVDPRDITLQICVCRPLGNGGLFNDNPDGGNNSNRGGMPVSVFASVFGSQMQILWLGLASG